MINSTHNVHIDGSKIKQEDLMQHLNLDSDDRFTRWVVRPIGVMIALGIGAAALVASLFMMALSLAMVPLLLLGGWALKRKFEKDTLAGEATVETSDESVVETHA